MAKRKLETNIRRINVSLLSYLHLLGYHNVPQHNRFFGNMSLVSYVSLPFLSPSLFPSPWTNLQSVTLWVSCCVKLPFFSLAINCLTLKLGRSCACTHTLHHPHYIMHTHREYDTVGPPLSEHPGTKSSYSVFR